MSHTYVSCLVHCIFSTKDRAAMITPDLQPRLWAYLGGIARANDITPMAIGGSTDHAHLLLGFKATMPIARAIQLVKGGSSKWIHETFPVQHLFSWQEGYGAFTISHAEEDAVTAYIKGQLAHHHTQPFQEEFLAFLERYGIQYDPRYIWD